MADNRTVVLLVGAFLTLIVGVSLIGVIASEEQGVVSFTDVSNETVSLVTLWAGDGLGLNESLTVDVTNAYTGTDFWKAGEGDCDNTNVAVANASVYFTITTDYTLSDGTLTIVPTAAMNRSGNTTLVTYSYCPDNYMTESWGRSTMDVMVGFFALALLGISVGLFYQVMKNEGLINI